jgi:hypothetical protein
MLENLSLEKSDLYFALLQLLRYMKEWIDSSTADLVGVKKGFDHLLSFERPYPPEHEMKTMADVDMPAMRNNWDILVSRHKEKKEILLLRIEQMREDVVTLRDGVSGLAGRDL